MRPSLKDLGDPFLLKNMDLAVRRLVQAVENKESVLVLGDYDVDGVTSTALLVRVLNQFGLKPRYVIPIRSEEGYGLTHSILERSLAYGKPELFIALDCGTNSHDEVAYLKSEGVDVMIVDHHQRKEGVSSDAILINPHVNDEKNAPWLQMCTVGLVFKLFHALVKYLRESGDLVAQKIKVRDCLHIVAMGTVADMVPLLKENRVLTKYGLEDMKNNSRPGLKALCNVSGLTAGQDIKPMDIAFKLGPRINASGRLADAALSVSMLLGNDVSKCSQIAKSLDIMNRERQEIEKQVMEEVLERVEVEGLSKSLAIVLYGEAWHSGVVGIVAGKLCRLYHRPCIVLGKDGRLAKGSGRSVDGVNLVQALSECKEYLGKWGGHPMAAGVGMEIKQYGFFREAFVAAVSRQTGNKLPEPSMNISEWLPIEALQGRLLDELDMLHPFGMSNLEPVFGLREVVLTKRPDIFAEEHFRFQLPVPNAPNISGVAWKMADRLPPVEIPIDMAIRFGWRYWNGRKFPQVQLEDWRMAEHGLGIL